MDKKKLNLVEQEAPEKNTDRAFVRVGRDGSPDLPGGGKKPVVREKDSKKPRK